jgi:2,4-dienoyl-CoA reductase-like NADH-dependent reductase (Old Yellow Enzyme family)
MNRSPLTNDPLQTPPDADQTSPVSALDPKRSLLFSPLTINGVTLENRVWLPAMVTWLSNEEGEVTPDVIQRYVTYARGEPGMIVLEAMGIRDVASGPLMRIGADRYVPDLRDLVKRIHDISPSKVIPQVIDFLKIARRDPKRYLERLARRGGKYADVESMDDARLRATLTEREYREYGFGYRQLISDITREEVLSLPGLFAAAGRRAREAGFDGVELHFAHAYTMSSFLSGCNARTDEFGGQSLENRIRMPLRVIEAVRREVGDDFMLGLRYLSAEDIEGGTTIEDAEWFGVEFAKAGVDFISISRGGKFEDAKQPRVGEAAYPYTGHSGHMCMPMVDENARTNRENSARIRRAIRAAGYDTPTVTAGRINTFEMAEGLLRDGGADLIGMARGLLADPFWPVKVREGRDFHHCLFTNVCEALDRHHRQVRCQLWMKEKGADGKAIHHIHPPEGWEK